MPKQKADRVRQNRQAGFSLFECVVALGIFSMVAMSSLTLVTQNAESAVRLEVRTYASFVAENLMVDTRLETVLTTSDTAGVAEMGGFDFAWERSVVDTDQAALKRIHIRVRRQGEAQILAELGGFWNG